MKVVNRYGVKLAGLLLLVAAFVTGCNTVDGAGKDIEAAGEEVQEAAD